MDKENQRLKEREEYIKAFNDTMVAIWKEKIVLLGAMDTKSLLDSVVGVRYTYDEKIVDITLEQAFLYYGVYVDAGSGKETPKGNPGDIGRDKVRKPKPWFLKKYTASWLNLRDFLAENIGQDMADSVCKTLSGKMS